LRIIYRTEASSSHHAYLLMQLANAFPENQSRRGYDVVAYLHA
jgi:hypothetical protein